MKLGCLTVPFGDGPLERVVQWAAELVSRGFHPARDVLRPYVV